MTTTQKILDLIEQLRQQSKSFCIATVINISGSTAAVVGTKAVITEDGEMNGFIGGGCVTGAVKRNALECLESGKPKLIRVAPKDKQSLNDELSDMQLFVSHCASGGTTDFFLEPVSARQRLFICGASPIAQSLLNFAKKLGRRVIVIAAQGDQAKILGADEYFEDYEFDQWQVTADDSIVIATQGKQDLKALLATLHSLAGYKAMICSVKKLKSLKQKVLAETDDDKALFSDLYAPAGLDIGAVSPEEIALAIMSEMVAHHRKTTGGAV